MTQPLPQLLNRYGFSTTEIGDLCHIPPQTTYKWRKQKPQPEHQQPLTQLLKFCEQTQQNGINDPAGWLTQPIHPNQPHITRWDAYKHGHTQQLLTTQTQPSTTKTLLKELAHLPKPNPHYQIFEAGDGEPGIRYIEHP